MPFNQPFDRKSAVLIEVEEFLLYIDGAASDSFSLFTNEIEEL
jgi:hypothetical protein